jgi:hypothetical protein
MVGTTLLLVVFGALAISLIAYGLMRDRQRRRAFERIAPRVGLRVEPSTEGLREALAGLPSMTRTRRHLFSHVLRGAESIVCDWRILEGPKQRPRRSTQTLVAVRLADARLPSFRLAARTNHRALADRLVPPPVDFRDATRPDEAIAVAGPDAAALRAVFDETRRSRIDLPKDLVLEGAGDWIAGFVPGRRTPPGEVAALLERVRVLADQIVSD